ncbi:MAG: hypothetical protein RLZ57_632 [Actinomycetota bacterium]|jgi:peptidyl-prolyl cis-trans isomerase B (cyclophilin B)
MGVSVKKVMVVLFFMSLFVAPAEAAPTLNCKEPTAKVHEPLKLKKPKTIAKKLASTFTISTNCGEIVIKTVGKKAPETISDLAFIANSKFYDDSFCHRLTTQGLYVLQCGDPTATGGGGPNFKFKDENLPLKDEPANYPKGTVAMANSGPNTNGSQFFLVYQDTQLPPKYTIWGKITKGLDVVEAIAAQKAYKPQSDGKNYYAPDGYPVQPVQIYKIRAK